MRVPACFCALVLAGALILPSAAFAHSYKVGNLALEHPWTRATPAGARVGGGFVVIENKGAEPDRLIGGTFAGADKVEIHAMAVVDGVMTMRPEGSGLEVPAGGKVTLEPGGLHLMLVGLKQQLKQGDRVAGTLVFEKAGTVSVEFAVEAIGAKETHHEHTQ